MTNHVFKPNNFGVQDGILKMYFNDNDIILHLGATKYHLIGTDDSIIHFDLTEERTRNTNTRFTFVSQTGQQTSYNTVQLTNIKGIYDAIRVFASGLLTDEAIRFEPDTDKLMNEIMNFHVDNVVNTALDLKEFDRLKVLVDNGLL